MIGKRIRALRLEQRLGVRELAEMVGVSAQAVSNWETIEGRGPSRETLPRVARALGVSTDELLREPEGEQLELPGLSGAHPEPLPPSPIRRRRRRTQSASSALAQGQSPNTGAA